jgi:hypothetical protein
VRHRLVKNLIDRLFICAVNHLVLSEWEAVTEAESVALPDTSQHVLLLDQAQFGQLVMLALCDGMCSTRCIQAWG